MTIASEITRLSNAKSAIKSAIEAKLDGDTIPSSTKLDGYPTYIAQIEQGGGASVPYLPATLVMSTQKTSDYYTPAYVGTYTKQNTPSDWTDTYYRKPPVGSQYDPVSPAYYMCCAESNGEYVWFVTTIDPSGNGDPLSAIQEMSVYSEVPIAPQDVRWTNDTVEDEPVIIIVEDSAGDTTPSGGGEGGGGGSQDTLIISNGGFVNGTYTLNQSTGRYETGRGDQIWYDSTSHCWYVQYYEEASANYSRYDESGNVSNIIGTYYWDDLIDQGMDQQLTITAGSSGGGGSVIDGPYSVWVSYFGSGSYVKTSDTCNNHYVYYCSDTGRYLFVTYGEGNYLWAMNSTVIETVNGDLPTYLTVWSYDTYADAASVPGSPVGNYNNQMTENFSMVQLND